MADIAERKELFICVGLIWLQQNDKNKIKLQL
jgi:hypothetical protein